MSISGGVDLAPERGQSATCKTIQVFVKNNHQWEGPPISRDEATRFKASLKNHSIRAAFAHTCYLINLCAVNPETRQRSIQAMIDEIERCHLLGLPHLVLHPGSHMGAGVEAGIRKIAEAINHILSKTPRKRTAILLETTAGQGTGIGSRFEHLAEIIRRVKNKRRIGVCLDTCHVFAAGYDIRTAAGWRKTMREFDRTVGLKKLMAFHLNDSKREFDSHVDRHAHIGEGHLGLEAFRAIIRDRRFARHPAVLETPKGPDLQEDIENLNRLRSLI